MHQFAANARDIALGTILVAAISGFASALTGVALGRFLPTRFVGWAVLAAVVATTTVVAGIDAGDPPTDNLDAAADEMAVLIVGIQPFAFSFGLWIGRTLRRGAAIQRSTSDRTGRPADLAIRGFVLTPK